MKTAVAMLFLLAGNALAQSFPSKPVRMIVPLPEADGFLKLVEDAGIQVE